MKEIIYLDHSATTAVSESVLKEMMPYYGKYYGNASGLYFLAEESKKALEISRQRVARAINARANEIYFLSGGSEADNLAIKGVARANKRRGNHIITTKIEHKAILNACKTLEQEGFEVTYLDVLPNGMIRLEDLRKAIRRNTILISIMFANNEIGTIQPIEQIGLIARKYNIIFHTDAVQAIGQFKVDVQRYNIDLLSISAHKFYGPKGVGAIYVRQGVKIDKLIDGGTQEGDLRSGTENIPGIVGLGKAIEDADINLYQNTNRLLTLRENFIKNIEAQIPDVIINGDRRYRLPCNVSVSFRNIDAKTLITELSNRKICVSGGSACSSKNPKPSHVLRAIGLQPNIANNTIRVTFGLDNDMEDVVYTVNQIKDIINN